MLWFQLIGFPCIIKANYLRFYNYLSETYSNNIIYKDVKIVRLYGVISGSTERIFNILLSESDIICPFRNMITAITYMYTLLETRANTCV